MATLQTHTHTHEHTHRDTLSPQSFGTNEEKEELHTAWRRVRCTETLLNGSGSLVLTDVMIKDSVPGTPLSVRLATVFTQSGEKAEKKAVMVAQRLGN